LRRVLEIAGQYRCYLRGGGCGAAVEKQAAYAERTTRERKHAPQLTRTYNADAG